MLNPFDVPQQAGQRAVGDPPLRFVHCTSRKTHRSVPHLVSSEDPCSVYLEIFMCCFLPTKTWTLHSTLRSACSSSFSHRAAWKRGGPGGAFRPAPGLGMESECPEAPEQTKAPESKVQLGFAFLTPQPQLRRLTATGRSGLATRL